MDHDEYSPYKMVHHPEHLRSFKEGLLPAPLQIHLVPTNRCNQSCVFCAYRMPASASNQQFHTLSEIPIHKLLEIVHSCKEMGVKAIQITGGGEPLVHPHIKDLITAIKNAGIELAMVTNGQALDDELIDMLSNVTWVRISVDAACPTTYSMIRKVLPKRFNETIENIRKLCMKKTSTTLGVGFVVSRENYTEIFDAASLFKNLGVDNFRISASFTPAGISYFNGILEPAKELAAKAKKDLESPSYTIFNLFNERIADIFHGVQDYDFCPMARLVPYIGADLNVYTCCVLAYNEAGKVGSIANCDLKSMWQSPETGHFFSTHSPRRSCQLPCMFEGKNKFVNYCIKTDAKHINFP